MRTGCSLMRALRQTAPWRAPRDGRWNLSSALQEADEAGAWRSQLAGCEASALEDALTVELLAIASASENFILVARGAEHVSILGQREISSRASTRSGNQSGRCTAQNDASCWTASTWQAHS